jgi:hypothetical protein
MKSTKSNIRTYMNMNTQPLNKVSTKIWGISKLKVHTIKKLTKTKQNDSPVRRPSRKTQKT